MNRQMDRWNPPGKRKQGRPKMTLRKTFEGDLKKMELTRGTAEREAKVTFMEEKEQLHYPEWIDALKEEEDVDLSIVKVMVLNSYKNYRHKPSKVCVNTISSSLTLYLVQHDSPDI